ncbi:MAG TPA: DEAD/DEAH box helicase [Polyangiaceae bacterium]|nr:DEAD/DEAH box helicase [Polyangiaceae bacterium]
MNALADFSPPVRHWFEKSFQAPTRAQTLGWGPIRHGQSTLLLAPTGSGKTLAAFLSSLDRLMTASGAGAPEGLSVLYVSPLKALAVDVDRNLRAPIAGIRAAAAELALPVREPSVAMRSGDTSVKDRARFQRAGADLLITTPESLYLLLTSQAARHFATLETVIIDEIHALLPTKRGAHLFLSLERLEALRTNSQPLQRIGLSATQRPLEEAARLLGGGQIGHADAFEQRPVEVVDARMPPRLHVEVRAAARGSDAEPAAAEAPLAAPPAAATPKSNWPEIHAPMLELIRKHRSTLVFVNSRRLAERLAQSLNELAGEEVALAHHGSLAKDRRAFIEDQLKLGQLRALVATSSLELGIDMGAIDLVIQVEAPPSVASGLQRIGRAGHSVGATSHGIMFPKHKGELPAAAVVARGMHEGAVEATRYPRNPLDVLAQQIVAMVVNAPLHVDALFTLCRQAAPFAELPRASFDGVLELLAGRYPSDEFSELRPRITWDRVSGEVSARAGARRIAVVSGGTIPDQGLYGVFLSNSEKPVRVGELDEEMVFESRAGEVFLLGASSWHIDEITHDRVLVSPAPGQAGKMPFWRGGGPGRPVELGRKIGTLTRELLDVPGPQAAERLREQHGFDSGASQTLLEYLYEQRAATAVVPSDRAIVVERFKDEVGDYRVCILSPFGRRVHAPWAMALSERFRNSSGAELDAVWSDDGIVLRLPDTEEQFAVDEFAPDPDDVEGLVVQALAKSSLFAAHFRENAGRALLLPKRDPRRRAPLWAQRRRAADLLRVASQYPSFPMILETYRECLRDVFDLPSLLELLSAIRRREVALVPVDSATPSPFSSTLLFSYVGNFLYDGDAPLAERRAQALVLDQAELRSLLGEAELRQLFDAETIESVERELLRLREPSLRHADDVHDLLLLLGDLTEADLQARAHEPAKLPEILAELTAARRIAQASIAGEPRYFAAEDAGKLRDALGVMPPPGLPSTFLAPVPDALRELLSRYARTHVPFTSEAPARRYGLGRAVVEAALAQLEQAGRVVHGEFLPQGQEREWCDKNVLRLIKQRSLAKLRKAIEPAPPEAFARLALAWQGTQEPSRSPDALERAIDQLQGTPIAASVLVQEVLPARVRGFTAAELDGLLASGELLWVGVEPHGSSDGKIALYRSDKLGLLAPLPTPAPGELQARLRAELEKSGALFFADLVRRLGGFPRDLLNTLWDLVWSGEVTNDTLAPLRSLQLVAKPARGRPDPRARRAPLPGSEGRWSLVRREETRSVAEQRAARARLLLDRHGIVSREIVNADGLGSFAELYPVFKAMEDAGKVRRGYFIAGLGGAQFAQPGADERLRLKPDEKPAVALAATDPANPYGAALPWPESEPRPQRTPGALVVIQQGKLLGYLSRNDRALSLFLTEEEPARSHELAALLAALKTLVGPSRRRVLLIQTIDRQEARKSPLLPELQAAGFTAGASGLSWRRGPAPLDEADLLEDA